MDIQCKGCKARIDVLVIEHHKCPAASLRRRAGEALMLAGCPSLAFDALEGASADDLRSGLDKRSDGRLTDAYADACEAIERLRLPVRCHRCKGPATMIDKAPPGESGDVVRCDVEAECVAAHDAARDLEDAFNELPGAAQEFIDRIGAAPKSDTMRIPTFAYAELRDVVIEWKEAGAKLIAAQRRLASKA